MTKRRKILTILMLSGISLGAAAAWTGAAALYGAYLYLNPKLPDVDSLKDVQLQEPMRVFTRDGKLIAEFGEKRRIPVVMEEVPDLLRQAFLAAEDDRFEEHPGVDYRGLLRAAINHALTGDKSQGGSTITMQVARNFFLSREKTYLRKLNEIFLALKIEKELSKDTILELYLNKIFFGKRAWGVAAAAQVYYGKSLAELELPEIAMIAGLPKAPSAFNPIVNPERALTRRNYVLGRMLELGFITAEEHSEASSSPVTAETHEIMVEVEAPYVAEMARAAIIERYGEDEAYNAGLSVYTTLDGELQLAANRALQNGLLDYEARHGYKGPIQNLVLPDGAETIQIMPPVLEEDLKEDSDASLLEIEQALPELAGSEEEQQEAALVHAIPQEEADTLISDVGYLGNIFPGLVLAIREIPAAEPEGDEQQNAPMDQADLYLGNGSYGELSFAGIQWAAPYETVNTKGKEPEAISDVLRVGDLVWLRADAAGALSLAQLPDVEGALAALDPQSGAVVSLVGGFDYQKSKFNRAVQAKRQPGSGFKPFVYSAALENGFTAASIINDAPVVFDDPALEGKWRPENYSGKFYGDTRLRQGLIKSRNLVSIRLLIALGTRKAREFARRFGFDDEALPNDLSLALGSGTIAPLDLVSGFATFANGGYKIEPFLIDSVVDADGRVIELADYELACLQCFVDQVHPLELEADYIVEWPPEPVELEEGVEQELLNESNQVEEQQQPIEEVVDVAAVEDELIADSALPADEGIDVSEEDSIEELYIAPKRVLKQAEQIVDPRVVFIMNSMLRDVVKLGTGRRALALGRNDLAGKTGTSNDEHDAWFNGFNHKYVASVWVGFDGHKPLGRGEPGGRAALPVWVDYMRVALEGIEEQPLKQPDDVVSIRIDAKTGLLASAGTAESLFEVFRSEHVPTEQAEETLPLLDAVEGEQLGEPVADELF